MSYRGVHATASWRSQTSWHGLLALVRTLGQSPLSHGEIRDEAGENDWLERVDQLRESLRRCGSGNQRSAARCRPVRECRNDSRVLVGRRIVEEEQAGQARAGYGELLIEHLSSDLTSRFGRGFGRRNLFQMRAFYLAYADILQTPSAHSAAGSKPKMGATPLQTGIIGRGEELLIKTSSLGQVGLLADIDGRPSLEQRETRDDH
jgi:hypothetical protein